MGTDPSSFPAAEALEAHKLRARTWFEHLRDDICAELERIEDALPAASRARRGLAPITPAHPVGVV